MSFNVARQPIDPFKLLGDSFSQVGPIYVPLLIIATPSLIYTILAAILPPALIAPIALVYGVIVTPIVSGIATYFAYRYLKQGTIDLPGATNVAMGNSVQLILGMILYVIAVVVGYICLIVPGIYISVIFAFVLYAIVTENLSAIDAFKYSAKLVKGRWWAVFGSMLAGIVIFLPVLVVSMILGVVMGANPSGLKMANIISGILSFVITPLLTLYFVKVYYRLQETDSTQPADV